jgi:Kef-type K+ transport system membrane component KefB
MEEDRENLNRRGLTGKDGASWVPAVQVFSEISTWIIVPIVLALFIGKSLDAHFGTKPLIFLISVGLAFLFSCFGIVRVVKNYMKKLQDTEKQNRKNN